MDIPEATKTAQRVYHRLVEARKSGDREHQTEMVRRTLTESLSLADGLAAFLVQREGQVERRGTESATGNGRGSTP